MKVAIILFGLFAHLMARKFLENEEGTAKYDREDFDDSYLIADSSKYRKIHRYIGGSYYNDRVYKPSFDNDHSIDPIKMYEKEIHDGLMYMD
ncbi:hypothetical protein QYM36_009113 [Artemia franciscana]|uniref:Uncharacterized protein n=1 Tax=Artemia franciscana TaxID=6661 RepID=A0AA88HV97_ARTSF|nr:hypothetical protein QYM36_009113 [Artemia franciscana]